MVDAQIVCQGELASDAADPPLISRLFMVIPVVKRISPELACRAEVIRRHSGYGARMSFGIELEQLFVRPDIGAVGGDENRDVADDGNVVFVCVFPQLEPLLLKDKLHEAVVRDPFFQLFPPELFRFAGGFLSSFSHSIQLAPSW